MMKRLQEDRFGHHFQAIQVRSEFAFTLQPVLLNNGAAPSIQALMLIPWRPFPFLDLPAEIRQMVYRIVCESSEAIAIRKIRRPSSGLTWSSREPTSEERIGTAPQDFFSLSLVSKKTKHEVVPVAYSFNRFTFGNFTVLSDFLIAIRHRARMNLRHLTLPQAQYRTGQITQQAFSLLNSARNLTVLRVPATMVPQIQISDFVKDTRSMFKTLEHWRHQNNNKNDILEIIEGQCLRCGAYLPYSRKKLITAYDFWKMYKACTLCAKEGHQDEVFNELKAALSREVKTVSAPKFPTRTSRRLVARDL